MTFTSRMGMAPGIRQLLVLGAIFALSLTAFSQYNFNKNCQQAYREIISLEFHQAGLLIKTEKQVDPYNLIPVYLENYIDFLQLFIGEEREVYDRIRQEKDKRMSLLQKGTKSSPYYHFLLGEVNLQWAIARLKFGDVSTAALEIRKAYAHFTENQEKFPAFLPNKIGLGTIHIIVGLIPPNYQWLPGLIGMEGSVNMGIAELKEMASYAGDDESMRLYVPEALFFLSFLQTNFHYDKARALSLLPIIDRHAESAGITGSPLLIYAKAMVLMRNGNSSESFNVLHDYGLKAGQYPFYFLSYLRGVTRLNNLDMEAISDFNTFLRNFRGQNYLASAHQRLAWIALLSGDTAEYYTQMKRVLSAPGDRVDEDRQAANEAQAGMIPNKVLLKSRLLFDGGYYDRALDELLARPLNSVLTSRGDLIEYQYRMARIYHEKGDIPRAVSYYKNTITLGKDQPFYFATSAAYQLGLIHEKRGEIKLADSAYRVCLSINSPQYKTSLHLKAKAGIERLQSR